MGSSIVRQWHLLTLLPKRPRRIDSATLEERLRARGLDVHRRTIQRDLIELAGVFPIVSDERTKPYGWCWADDAELLCGTPAPRESTSAVPEIDIVLRGRKAALRSVSEGLRGPEGQARDVAVDVGGGDAVLRARVLDTCAFRRWLFGFADAVEVVTPRHLRAELAEKAARIASIYEGASIDTG